MGYKGLCKDYTGNYGEIVPIMENTHERTVMDTVAHACEANVWEAATYILETMSNAKVECDARGASNASLV